MRLNTRIGNLIAGFPYPWSFPGTLAVPVIHSSRIRHLDNRRSLALTLVDQEFQVLSRRLFIAL